MQDASDYLRKYLSEHGLSQGELAKKAGVSQPTVSRALSKRPQRHGGACNKLFKYIGLNEWLDRAVPQDPKEQVLAAFERIWDKTEAHAESISHVIDALGGLRQPSHSKQKG